MDTKLAHKFKKIKKKRNKIRIQNKYKNNKNNLEDITTKFSYTCNFQKKKLHAHKYRKYNIGDNISINFLTLL